MRQYTFWSDDYGQYHRRYRENGEWVWHWLTFRVIKIEVNEYKKVPEWVVMPGYTEETYPKMYEAKLWQLVMPSSVLYCEEVGVAEIIYNKERQDDAREQVPGWDCWGNEV